MNLPTAEQFQQAATTILAEQQAWAQEHFFLPDLKTRLVVSSCQHTYNGQAQALYKDDILKAMEIKLCSFFFTRFEIQAWLEYASFERRPEIGSFATNDWQVALQALIAHELSHAVQIFLKHASDALRGSMRGHELMTGWASDVPVFGPLGPYEGKHGVFFQAIYAIMRNRFVNHQLSSLETSLAASFKVFERFEELLEQMPPTPLKGIKFVSKGRELTVVGRSPFEARRLYRYQVRDPQGKYLAIKLANIAAHSEQAREIINSDPELKSEFDQHLDAIRRKAAASEKIKETWRRKRENG